MMSNEQDLTIEHVSQFIQQVKQDIERDDSATPYIYYTNQTFQYWNGNKENKVANTHSDSSKDFKIIVTTEELRGIIEMYEQGVREGKSSIVMKAIANLLDKITTQEKQITTPEHVPKNEAKRE